jgi:hypothetical protein
MTNVQGTNGGVVHLGTTEWCGTDRFGRQTYRRDCQPWANGTDYPGFRSHTNFRPTKKEVTCKMCLKKMANG